MKTQWPRSADEPGVYMAQTGTGAAPVRGQAQDAGGAGLGCLAMGRGDGDGATRFASCPQTNLICSIYIFFLYTFLRGL